MIYNPLDKPANARLRDLNWREIGLLTPILVGILWMGLYPQPELRRMEATATRFVRDVNLRAAQQQVTTLGGGR
jgi:NADH:ubiquinone oxidoreductase subunit 4 (subunit M)